MPQNDPSRVLCLGEGLVVLHPHEPRGRDEATLLRCAVGGAEANVAGALALLGVPTTWISRLGDDPFGDLVERDLTARGITVLAERDADRPTGAYFKQPTTTGSRMYYHRAGSAATVMNGDLLDAPDVAQALAHCDAVHTSGITAGILAGDWDLIPRVIAVRDRHGFVLSVDLNWRPALWKGRDPRPLRELLTAADVVLLGADEAHTVFGTADPRRLREQIGPRPRLVLKSDAHEAIDVDPDGTTTQVPALAVDVVEPIGAGDGFAAGYLAALIDGGDATRRLRLGHLVAASVLAEHGDHARHLPEPSVRHTLLEASEDTWRATRVTLEGIEAPSPPATGNTR